MRRREECRMFELVQVNEKTYYIESPAKIGVYVADGTDVYLIDSGNDKDAGRKIRKLLDEKGWTLKGILNTHSNADHIGGNDYLQRQRKCKVFAGGIETAFTKYPILETSFLYGGYPCKDLRHKFLLAAASDAVDFSDADFPKDIEVIPLPGHFFDMVGFRTPDNTVFLADCLSSIENLDKYAVSFIYDVAAYLKTLDAVEAMEGDVFVPSHAAAGSKEDMQKLVQANRGKIYEIKAYLLSLCQEPMIFEHILQKVFDRYQLVMTIEQYVLVGSTIRSYLSWLRDTGEMTYAFEDHLMVWKTV